VTRTDCAILSFFAACLAVFCWKAWSVVVMMWRLM